MPDPGHAEERALALVESAPDALLLVDGEGNIVLANAQANAMFGYGPGELLGCSVDTLVPAGVRDIHPAHRAEFARAPCTRTLGARLPLAARRRDGTEFPVEIRLSPVQTASGSHVAAAVRDVTERLRSEQALREAEERFRTALDEAPNGMALVALDGHFLRVNRALSRIVGYSSEELMGLSFQGITHPDDIEADVAIADQLARGEIPKARFGKRYVRKDGTIIQAALRVSIVRDRDGAPLYFVTQIEDITQRKETEEALRRSQASLNRAQRVAHLGSWEWDFRTNAIERSPEMFAIFGVDASYAAQGPFGWTQFVVPEDRKRLCDAALGALASKGSFGIEVRILRPDGSQRVVFHQGEVAVEGGSSERMVGTCLDVTERKRLEEEREQSLRWLQAVLEQAAVGMILVHPPPNPRLEANPRALEMIGRPVEAIGQYPGLLDGPDGQPLTYDELPSARTLRGERIEETEYVLHHPDGPIPILVCATPIVGAEGQVQGGVIAFQDNRAAKASERLRAEWSSVVAHELRQPISTIVLSAELLGRSALDASLARAVSQIQGAARRLKRMVGDLMDLSRLEARHLDLTRQPIDVPAIVRASVDRVAQQAGGRPFDVKVEGEIPRAYADADRVAQVVENLLTNAVKYGTPGTPIVVEIEPNRGDVVVAVVNDGRVLAEDECAGMFQRFQRSERAKLAGVQSSGLGLYIARELVEAHGGKISVECTREGRATFRFTLPMASER